MKDFFEYNNDTIKITYSNYGEEDRNYGDLFDWLGEIAGFITLSELYFNCCSDDCGNLFDVNNDVAFEGVIWLNQPFEYVDNFLLKTLVYCVNYFRKDCFGRSQFLQEI